MSVYAESALERFWTH